MMSQRAVSNVLLPDPPEPRNKGQADDNDSSNSGIFSYHSQKSTGKCTNTEKIPIHRRPPVRLLKYSTNSEQANSFVDIKEKPQIQSIEEACYYISDSIPLMKMPDSDTSTTLNTEINTPIHPSSQKKCSTDLLSKMDWLLESSVKNRQLLRNQERQLIDDKIDQIKLFETPGKGLCNVNKNFQTPHNVTNEFKKLKATSSYKMSSSKHAFFACKSSMALNTHIGGVNTPTLFQNKNAVNIMNNSSGTTTIKTNTFSDVSKPQKNLDGHETLKNFVNEKQVLETVNGFSKAVIKHPKTFHQTPRNNENKENEVQWMPAIEDVSKNNENATVEPFNLNTNVESRKIVPKMGSLTEEYTVSQPFVPMTKHFVQDELLSEPNHPMLKSAQSYIVHHPVSNEILPDVKGILSTTKTIYNHGTITPNSEHKNKPKILPRPHTPRLPEPEKRNEHPQFKQPDPEKDRVMFSMPIAKSPSHSLTVNHKIYTILSKLGKGGSSIVYQVMDSENNKQLAIKCVRLGDVDRQTAQGYMNEVQILGKLQKCETVIRLFDYEYLNRSQTLMVVMEKGDVDLSNLLKSINKSSKISIHMIFYYWTEMLNAVKSIHENGIIHSDLKPANFLFVSGRLKLIDFGIASSLNKDVTSVVKETVVGTFNYISPEAVGVGLGKSGSCKISFKSDIWSLGCILYNLVYGRTPFAEIINHIFKLHTISDPNHEIKFPPLTDYPNILITIMKCCLQFDPKDRPTAAELLQHPYLPRVEDPFKMEKIKNIVTPDVWETIQLALS